MLGGMADDVPALFVSGRDDGEFDVRGQREAEVDEVTVDAPGQRRFREPGSDLLGHFDDRGARFELESLAVR